MNADTGAPGMAGARAEEILLSGVEAGEEDAFRALYRLHTPRLRQVVLRLMGAPHSDADDVVQEAWIRAIAGLRRFRRDGAFRTWLIGIGIRTAYEFLRRRRRWSEVAEPEDCNLPARQATPGERIDLEQALAILPAPCRAVLLLHDLEGFTHEEIAAQLHMAVGTSKARLFRARRTMRRLLDYSREASHDGSA
jgi:RNA polymerase sigma-70 factor (ECF subfamily)